MVETYETTLIFTLAESKEYEMHARIEYLFVPAYDGGRISPSEPASVEIIRTLVYDVADDMGSWVQAPSWIDEVASGDCLRAAVLADYFNRREAAKCDAAEARREMSDD